MITLKTLRWSNLFSYGENNVIDFSANPLTQIVGFNGHGKSSIALILEEALYNKNSKGIKKADVLNRNSSAKSYNIELVFEKDGSEYKINTVRGTTQTVKLFKDGVDISSHTATGTYKIIEELIGYDHKTFAQIVYQSSSGSLEFLTATDGNRKKFLIDLLNLTRYVEAGEVFKAAVKELTEESLVLNTQLKGDQAWLDKYSSTDLSLKPLVLVPDSPRELIEATAELRDSLKNIEATNKKIVQNNKYKELLDSTVVVLPGPLPQCDTKKITVEKTEYSKSAKDAAQFIQKMNKLSSQCPTCLQSIDVSKVAALIAEQELIKSSNELKTTELATVLENYETALKQWNTNNQTKESYENYHNLYDPELQTELLDKIQLSKTIAANEVLIQQAEDNIKAVTDKNTKATAHNAKVDVIKTQLEEVNATLAATKHSLSKVTEKLTNLQVLVKTFSSTGLVAYKIECLVKDLESVTNRYLTDLSSGRFQITFKISSSDKLNVVITDNGKDIEIIALSGGERARVNVAALLGIRKLMQSLSNTRINLLVLDETIENLDLDGKEKLVEVLLQEEYLNTFVISHGFSHPLLEKIHVVKNNNISRIEHG